MPNKEFMTENTIKVLLKEYESLRSELFINLQAFQQTLSLVLGTVAIAIPLIFGQINNLSPITLGILLYLLAIIYAVISMQTSMLQYNINVSGYYINTRIEPRLNELLLYADENQKVLYWETFTRKLRSKPLVLIASTTGTIGAIILMSLPSGISLLVANYIFSTSSNNSTPSLFQTVIVYLGWFALIIYIISLLSWLIVVLLSSFEFRMVQKFEPKKFRS